MRKSFLIKIAAITLSVIAVFGASYAYATGQTVTGLVSMNAAFSEVSNTGIVSNTLGQAITWTQTYSNGTGSGQVDTIYAAKLTLSGTTTTLDLTSLTDPANNSINFARVREFIVQNPNTSAGFDVKVEAGASNGWAQLPTSSTPLYARYNNGIIRISDPTSTGSNNGNVVSSTSKTVTLDPGANTVTVYVLIVGGSAAFVIVIPFNLRRYRRRLAA